MAVVLVKQVSNNNQEINYLLQDNPDNAEQKGINTASFL